MLDLSNDFVIIDNMEAMRLRKVRGGAAIDFEDGKYIVGVPQHEQDLPLPSCLVRLVSNRDNALVKQIFQRGVALAALDFSIVDTIVEVYDSDLEIRLEDIVIRDRNGAEYVIIAIDDSHVTQRKRLACRRNK